MAYVHAMWLAPLALNISPTSLTIIFIVLAALVGAFIRRICRDKCLKDFSRNMVTMEVTTGKIIWGKLRVENTGLEFISPQRAAESQKKDNKYFQNG